jgi:hypothetical protein
MADAWGSWVSNSSFGRIRMGATIVPYVYADRVDFYLGVDLQSEYAISDSSNLFAISGNWSRSASSISVSTPSGGGTDTLWSEAVSSGHLYRVYGSPGQTVTASVTASIDNLYEYNNKASVSYSESATIPAVVPTMGTISASAGIRSASISFSASSNGGSAIDYYHIYKNNAYLAQVTSSPYSATLGNDETASFKVYAHNGVGWSAASNTVTVTTPALPTAPTGVTANASTFGQIGLSWTASNGDGYTVTYTIRRDGTVLGTTTGTSYTDTTVAPSTAYTYTVTPSTSVGSGTAGSVSTTSLGGIARIYNGTTNVTALPKIWNGTVWVDGQARVWNGTEWKYGS